MRQAGHKGVVVLVLLAWLPLSVLSMLGGTAWGAGIELPFFEDLEAHGRLLLSVPLLILAEPTVRARLRRITDLFVERGLVRDEDRIRYDRLVASSLRARESVVAKALLLAFVYGVGVLLIWRKGATLDVSSWYALPSAAGEARLTAAGWWFACVSQPLFQFLLLQWYFRLLLWAVFLFRVSRLDLRLMAIHPDRTAGLSFLSMVVHAYAIVMAAQGVVLAGMIGNRIFHAGAALVDFKPELIGIVALMLLAVLGPLLFFHPMLREARREGKEQLSSLGQRYARDFEHRWMQGEVPPGQQLLGHADIQSLADMRDAFLAVSRMRVVPFTMENVMTLALATLLPVAPLLLTMFSLEQLLERVLKAIF
jgi:hypothetical protein